MKLFTLDSTVAHIRHIAEPLVTSIVDDLAEQPAINEHGIKDERNEEVGSRSGGCPPSASDVGRDEDLGTGKVTKLTRKMPMFCIRV